MHDNINHPLYYGGSENPFEPIKIIDHYKLGFALGNAIKYILRAGLKPDNNYVQDLEKAKWYINHEIERCKKK